MNRRELPVGWIGWSGVTTDTIDKGAIAEIDRVVDEWYERAPLFPGDRSGDTWRECAPVPFFRRRGKA